MRGRWLLTAGLVLFLAVLAGLFTAAQRGAFRPPPPPKPVAKPALPAEVSLPGRVVATKVVNVPVPIDGILQRFMADVGEDVFEGELLAQVKNMRVDSTAENAQAVAERAQARVNELQSALIAAKLEASRARADATRTRTEFVKAEKAYQRQKMLMNEGATPRLTFEKSEADYKKLKADLDSFESLAQTAEDKIASLTKEVDSARTLAQSEQQQLDEARADAGAGEVRSPVNGIVVGRQGQAGEPIARDVKDMFQIAVDLSALQVVATPDPQTISRVKPGQPALVVIAEAPAGIPGTVRELKGGQVFVEFASPSAAIRPGVTAQVKIKVG